MNPREKRMAVILGALLVVAAIAGGYIIVYEPWASKKDQIAKLKKEIVEKEEKQDQYTRLAFQVDGFSSVLYSRLAVA